MYFENKKNILSINKLSSLLKRVKYPVIVSEKKTNLNRSTSTEQMKTRFQSHIYYPCEKKVWESTIVGKPLLFILPRPVLSKICCAVTSSGTRR